MSTAQRSIVVFVFEDPRQADRAVADLRASGFGNDRIGVAMRHQGGSSDAGSDVATGTRRDTGADASTGPRRGTGTDGDADADTDVTDSPAAKGALTGALAGLGLGALAGLRVLAGVIPAI